MRFLAPRVSGALRFRAVETPPVRVIRGRFFARHTCQTRGSCSYRDLTGTIKVPVTLVGCTYRPSQFCPRPRVTTPHRRLAPTCRFAVHRREFHRRGVHLQRRTRG